METFRPKVLIIAIILLTAGVLVSKFYFEGDGCGALLFVLILAVVGLWDWNRERRNKEVTDTFDIKGGDCMHLDLFFRYDLNEWACSDCRKVLGNEIDDCEMN